MKKKEKIIVFTFVLAGLLSLGLGMDAKTDKKESRQNKSNMSAVLHEYDYDINNLEYDLQRHAYKVFHEKIIGAYLYDENLNQNAKNKRAKKLIPENVRIGDKKYKTVMNYSVFTSRFGDADAELFWNIVKDATFYHTVTRQGLSKNDNSPMHHVTVDTMKLNYVNADLDTVNMMLIFGNKYIDFYNPYVAKHANEIRQICAESRRIDSIKAKMNELESKKIKTIKDDNTIIR